MWLLESSIRRAIEQAQQSGIMPTAEQQAQFEASRGTLSAESSSRIMVTAGETAEISVRGVLTNRPSFFAMLFGGGNTTFPEINAALAEADADPNIKDISLRVDSPGGTIDGLFDTLAALEATQKPITANVSNLAASAAFAIVSKADKVVAGNRAARFGSIGIVAGFGVDEEFIEITSTNAPKKRPDVTTPEGVAEVREELDALHDIFVEAIADGRGTTPEKVNADFGQGAVLLADEALNRGMIDAVGKTSLTVVKKASKTDTAAFSGGNKPEKGPMDLNTLKASHPDVYAAAVQDGVTQERDRVGAHLTMGDASGDMKTAIGAINDGSAMTASLQAAYMAAGMNRKDVANRKDDDADADGADGLKPNKDTGEEAAESVVSGVEKMLGLEA